MPLYKQPGKYTQVPPSLDQVPLKALVAELRRLARTRVESGEFESEDRALGALLFSNDVLARRVIGDPEVQVGRVQIERMRERAKSKPEDDEL